MSSKLIKPFILLFFLQAFLPIHVAFADTGPKPTMDFQIQFESGVAESGIVSGILFQCNESDCSDATPLEEVGPQRLYCEPQNCRAIGYGFAPFSLLELEFSDGVTRRSNIFEQAGFDSRYTVYVRPEDLLVEAKFSLVPSLSLGILEVITCICALIGLGLIAGLGIFLIRRSKTT